MQKTRPERIKAIFEELEKSSADYLATKQKFDRSRVEFEAARKRFAGVRRLASEMLTTRDWRLWKSTHPQVQYVGMAIGDAIGRALEDRAWDSAFRHAENRNYEFSPEMTMDRLMETLEAGGFEFQSATPLRELNAALINLKGITKTSRGFRVSDAEDILAKALEPPEPE